MLRGCFIGGLLTVAGCTPPRVDIAEQPAGGFRAVAVGDDAESCRDARRRVADEARYHCEARGNRTRLGTPASTAEGTGCRVELPFWCTTS